MGPPGDHAEPQSDWNGPIAGALTVVVEWRRRWIPALIWAYLLIPLSLGVTHHRRRAPGAFRAALIVGVGLAALAVGPSLAIAGRLSGNDSPTSFLVNQSANSEPGDRQADPGSAQPDADKGMARLNRCRRGPSA